MRITFDYSDSLDLAYLQLGEARPVTESIELEGHEDVRVDFDEEGQIVGVSFNEAQRRVPLGGFGLDETLADED